MFQYQFHISPGLVGALVAHLPHVPPAAKQIIEAVASVANTPFDVHVGGDMDHTGQNVSHISFSFTNPLIENPSADARPASPFVAVSATPVEAAPAQSPDMRGVHPA